MPPTTILLDPTKVNHKKFGINVSLQLTRIQVRHLVSTQVYELI